MSSKDLKTYFELEKELTSNKLRQVYFISAFDGYFTNRFLQKLQNIKFHSTERNENYFIRYADETSIDQLIELCTNFTSLFSTEKLVVVKRSEKYSRNYSKLIEFTSKTFISTTLVLIFDRETVLEKKMYDKAEFFELSELKDADYIKWIKEEINIDGYSIDSAALNYFIDNIPKVFDLVYQEIIKIKCYLSEQQEKKITIETLNKLLGYSEESTPLELLTAILDKDTNRTLQISDYLLNSASFNEINLVSMLSYYFGDLLCFKSKEFSKTQRNELYNKYRIWGDRSGFARTYSNKITFGDLSEGFNKIVSVEHKLKTSMLDSKVLFTSLVKDLSSGDYLRN